MCTLSLRTFYYRLPPSPSLWTSNSSLSNPILHRSKNTPILAGATFNFVRTVQIADGTWKRDFEHEMLESWHTERNTVKIHLFVSSFANPNRSRAEIKFHGVTSITATHRSLFISFSRLPFLSFQSLILSFRHPNFLFHDMCEYAVRCACVYEDAMARFDE